MDYSGAPVRDEKSTIPLSIFVILSVEHGATVSPGLMFTHIDFHAALRELRTQPGLQLRFPFAHVFLVCSVCFFSRSSFSFLALTVHTILRGKLPINWLYLVFETAYTVSLFLSLPRLPSSSLCFFRVLPGTQAATFR